MNPKNKSSKTNQYNLLYMDHLTQNYHIFLNKNTNVPERLAASAHAPTDGRLRRYLVTMNSVSWGRCPVSEVYVGRYFVLMLACYRRCNTPSTFASSANARPPPLTSSWTVQFPPSLSASPGAGRAWWAGTPTP